MASVPKKGCSSRILLIRDSSHHHFAAVRRPFFASSYSQPQINPSIARKAACPGRFSDIPTPGARSVRRSILVAVVLNVTRDIGHLADMLPELRTICFRACPIQPTGRRSSVTRP